MTAARPGETAGLLVRTGWGVVRARGADHVDYLHRMTSQDVAGLAPGRAALALVLTPQGRILGDPVLWRGEEEILLELDPRARDKALPALERLVIADDVAFEDVSSEHGVLHVVGGAAPAAIASLGVPDLADLTHASLPAGRARVLRRDLGRIPAYTVIARGEDAPRVERDLAASPGVARLDADGWDALRVEEGVPAYGAELGPDVMPLEANLEERAISWTKGCYPGQEPVVMARHRGKPPHRLVRFVADEAGTRPEVGVVLLHEGRPAGRVTTVVREERSPARGLALLRHALAGDRGGFDLEGGGHVRTEPITP